MSYELILTETHNRVGLVTLNRPAVRNALNNQVLHELMNALESFDMDPAVGAMVITGTEKAFAAGADIKEMAPKNATEMMASGFISAFGRLRQIRKPVIAAVSGWALGGGFEIALACDMLVASDTAKFGQPEITIGIIPGGGGTQRLVRAAGKALAMEVILNNRQLTAQEALQLGLVNRVVPVQRYLAEAIELAQQIAMRAPLAVQAAKELIDQANDTGLAEGLQREQHVFFALFDTADRKEGMEAFTEKRDPRWNGR